jgi:autotransporter-associated beta strand protein
MNLKNDSQVHRLTAIVFILALALAPTANAADGTWTGGSSATWATPANWFGSIVPGGSAANSDLATFNSGTYSFAPTAASSYFIGGLIFGSSNGAITITTGTANNRLNVGSSGIQLDGGSGAVSLGAAATQGASIVANQNWANNSSSLLTVNRVSVDDASSAGTYTLTINGSGAGGVNFLTDINDVNGASDPTRLFALQINSTGGNTTISSANRFTGGTTLTQGNLLLGNNTALGTGSLALNGGKISSSSTGSQAPANNTTIGGNVTLGDAVNTGKLTFSGTMGLGGDIRTLTTDSSVEFSGVVSNGGITKQGASTLTFLGASANTYTGLTTVRAGGLTLNKTAVDAIAGNVLVNGTGILTLGAANQINNASDVEVAAGTFALGAFSDTVNNLKLTGGTITGSAGGILTSSTAYDFQSSGNVTGSLAGTAGANKTTAGTVTFTGANANTYTGLTTVSAGSLVLGKTASVVALAGDALVNGGTLQIVNSNQIQDSANVEVATGGTFAMGGNTDTVNGVKLTGGAITGTGVNGILTSITAYDLQSGSSSAVLAGAAGANKTTAGTVALNKANTYSGDTTLSAGTLQLGVASVGSVGAITSSAIGTGILGLNGGTLSSDSNANRTILNATTIGGDVTLGDAVANGTLTFSAGVDLSGIARTLTTASAATFNGVVSNGGINKAGESTLTLGGANTYSGLTTINQGTLAVTGSLLNTGTVLVNDGGSLSGSGSVGAVTLASGSVLRPGDSPGILTAASSIWQAGSTYSWEIDNATGLAETNWDVFSVTGELDMSALSSGAQMNLVLNSLSLANFDTSSTYTWVIAKAGSFTGYDDDNTNLTSLFDIDTANFNGGLPANLPTGGFQVVTGTEGSLRTLNLMAIPEPSTGTLLGFGLGGLVLTRLLRRKQS